MDADLERFIKDLSALKESWGKIQKLGKGKYNDGVDEYDWYRIPQYIGECIRWATQILHNDHFYFERSGSIGDDDDGQSRGPTDLRDDWPHAIPVPGGAWLPQTNQIPSPIAQMRARRHRSWSPCGKLEKGKNGGRYKPWHQRPPSRSDRGLFLGMRSLGPGTL